MTTPGNSDVSGNMRASESFDIDCKMYLVGHALV